MARKKKDGYMPKSEVLLILQNYIRTIQMNDYGTDSGIPQLYKAMTYIEDAPTADVAEVVRCSECKHYEADIICKGVGYCNEHQKSMRADDFCSYGERRKENE